MSEIDSIELQELVDDIEKQLEGIRCAINDEEDWRKEIRKDLKKIINILDNWS